MKERFSLPRRGITLIVAMVAIGMICNLRPKADRLAPPRCAVQAGRGVTKEPPPVPHLSKVPWRNDLRRVAVFKVFLANQSEDGTVPPRPEFYFVLENISLRPIFVDARFDVWGSVHVKLFEEGGSELPLRWPLFCKRIPRRVSLGPRMVVGERWKLPFSLPPGRYTLVATYSTRCLHRSHWESVVKGWLASNSLRFQVRE